MSILFVESFDNQSAAQLSTFGKWFEQGAILGGGGVGSASVSLSAGRFSPGSALLMSGAVSFSPFTVGYFLDADVGANEFLFLGFGYKTNGESYPTPALYVYDSVFNLQLQLQLDGTRIPFVSNSVGTILGAVSTSGSLSTGTWYWVDFSMRVNNTLGWMELRFNNSLVASYYGTGTNRATANGNTRNSSSTLNSARFIRFGHNGTAGSFSRNYDDIVINNSAGAVNTDVIGDVRVIGLLPNAVGTNSGMTRTGGTVSGNFTAVNENPVDSDTSYVSSSVVGTTDTYHFASLPASASSILAVVASPVGRRDDSGSRSITTRVRSGGTEADSPNPIALGPSYTANEQILEVNPVTGVTWTVGQINAVEMGPRIAS